MSGKAKKVLGGTMLVLIVIGLFVGVIDWGFWNTPGVTLLILVATLYIVIACGLASGDI